jgi:hypothetical protein
VQENQSEESSSETTPEEAVSEVLSDGNLTAADAEAVLDSVSADGEVTQDEANTVVDALAGDGKLTTAEKELIAEVLIQASGGEAVSSEILKEAGLEYKDLPAETPVDVRTDENGNAVIIVAEVAAALEVLENPAELLGAVFEDPGQVLLALGSIGADMSPEEREEATDMVVATVVAAGAAINAIGAAGGATGGSTGGGSSGGGGGAPSGDSKGVRRRPKP